MQNPISEDQSKTLRGVTVERSPLVIACAQTAEQRLEAKMDDLFQSSTRVIVDLPIECETFTPPTRATVKTSKARTVESGTASKLKTENADARTTKTSTTRIVQSTSSETVKTPPRKRRLATTSAAGRNRRMEEFQQESQATTPVHNQRFSLQTLKLAGVLGVCAAFFRTHSF
jgi:hypothetical protein